MKIFIRGYTLLEFLIYAVLLSVLLLAAYPSFYDLYQKNQVDMIADSLKNALIFSRDQALHSAHPLTLNPISDADTVENKDWSKGMILFSDNHEHIYSKKDKIIQQWVWQADKVRIQWQGFQSKDYLTFANKLSQSSANGQFIIQSSHHYQRKLIVNRLGHIREALHAG